MRLYYIWLYSSWKTFKIGMKYFALKDMCMLVAHIEWMSWERPWMQKLDLLSYSKESSGGCCHNNETSRKETGYLPLLFWSGGYFAWVLEGKSLDRNKHKIKLTAPETHTLKFVIDDEITKELYFKSNTEYCKTDLGKKGLYKNYQLK